ncbi:hypothetical protein BU23DRAFT_625497 [Bimuria novae-zelandiae CBS 107.79]|uniref:Uncharacterized protein n=1 Tax=Bimuria novae-zelandiae CBS 107.79 TaxID=1447943 RepID=A0A6A5W493_9PLEO|nr:hypothetical protein BU23DRAFT_625497 [Bimuria novae-zelandiae CBS 107.79]
MSGRLEAQWEYRARRLEPVPQICVPGFTVHDCAPEGHEPIWPGHVDEKGAFVSDWGYEQSQCPACILARIGSDISVLFALLAGMVARISRRRRGSKNKLRSRRVLFVKTWLEACGDGKEFVDDAFWLEEEMRGIKRELNREEHQAKKPAQNENGVRADISSHRQPDTPAFHGEDAPITRSIFGDPQPRPVAPVRRGSGASSAVAVDISDSYAPPHQVASKPPNPYVYSPAKQHSAIEVFDLSEPFIPPQSSSIRANVSSSEESLPRGDTRRPQRESNRSSSVRFDLSEPFIPASDPPSAKMAPHPATPARQEHREQDPPRPSTPESQRRFSAQSASEKHYSIASSFADSVSLRNLRAPSTLVDLYPPPLRTRNAAPPPVPERRRGMLPRPHPNSIYGAYGRSDANQRDSDRADGYADVNPPGMPTGRGPLIGRDARGGYDVSPLSSPERDAFETSPPATPRRPVTKWGGGLPVGSGELDGVGGGWEGSVWWLLSLYMRIPIRVCIGGTINFALALKK